MTNINPDSGTNALSPEEFVRGVMSDQQRDAFEATDAHLHMLKALAIAFDVIDNDHPNPDPKSDPGVIKGELLRLIVRGFRELDPLRAAEWVALGGKSDLVG